MGPTANIVESYCKYFHGLGEHDANLCVGTKGVAVMNITRCLHALGLRGRWSDEYTSEVRDTVATFQKMVKHQNVDGVVGPGTRMKLVTAALQRSEVGAQFFAKLDATWEREFYAAFVSYAWVDTTMLDKICACLEDKGARVLRDKWDFVASGELKDEIRRNIEEADTVLSVVTDESLGRDWVTYENQVAAVVGQWKPEPFCLYLKLTAKPMPAHLASRLYIEGQGRTLEQIGVDVEYAIRRRGKVHGAMEYDPNEILLP